MGANSDPNEPGGGGGGGGGPTAPPPQPPPPITFPDPPPPGGNVNLPTMSTPYPPQQVQSPPAQPVPPPTAPTPEAKVPVANKSPVGIMDWRTRLAQGDENAQTRGVTAPETVATQLTNLTSGDSRYVQIARDNAMRRASGSGMLTSSMAAGNAERAAIESALPIAQQDANTYNKAATDNMAAVNADRMADQSAWAQLTGQETGIRANLDEAERNRGWQSNEQISARNWQGTQNFQQRTHERGMQDDNQQFTAAETALERGWKSAEEVLNRNFNGSQLDKQLTSQRVQNFYEMMTNQQNMLSQQLAQIYSNPNLSASQQKAAADNAVAMMSSLFNSFNAAIATGIPQIFLNPYPQQQPA